MKVAIRVDASEQIGTGHFMRCLTLAKGLIAYGVQVRFVARHLLPHFQKLLTQEAVEYELLSSTPQSSAEGRLKHSHWLGVSQQVDALHSINALKDSEWDWLIVDSYSLDKDWELQMRNSSLFSKLLVIDDLADRYHDCNVLVDQNLQQKVNQYEALTPTDSIKLLGPKFSLLREEFRYFHKKVGLRAGEVKRVLIFFGGIDEKNYTLKVANILSNIKVVDFYVDVVVGAGYRAQPEIQELCLKHHFVLHVQIDYLADLMAKADIAFGTGGGAVWERCCLGLPTFTIPIADNHYMQVASSASEGLLYEFLPAGGVTELEALERHILGFLENFSLRGHISTRGLHTVDGLGVQRVLGVMGCSRVQVRLATTDDSKMLLDWRNHLRTRQFSRSEEAIDQVDHDTWFEGVLKNPDRLLLIGLIGEMPMGVVRFDLYNDEAEVSIYLDPLSMNTGLGHDLLRSAESYFRQKHPQTNLVANVLELNKASDNLFHSCDYTIESKRFIKRLN